MRAPFRQVNSSSWKRSSWWEAEVNKPEGRSFERLGDLLLVLSGSGQGPEGGGDRSVMEHWPPPGPPPPPSDAGVDAVEAAGELVVPLVVVSRFVRWRCSQRQPQDRLMELEEVGLVVPVNSERPVEVAHAAVVPINRVSVV